MLTAIATSLSGQHLLHVRKAVGKRMLCSTVHAVALLWWCNRLTSHISSWEPLIRGFSAQSQRTATQRRIHYGRAATGCRLNSDIAVSCISSKNHGLEGILQLGEGKPGLGLTAPAAQHQLVPVATITRREQKFQNPYCAISTRISTNNYVALLHTIVLTSDNCM